MVEPVGVAKPAGKFAEPTMDAILEHRLALLVSGLVALHEHGHAALDDRRLHCVKRGEHPCDRARPGIRIVRQQARMALGDMEHDRPGFETATGDIARLA